MPPGDEKYDKITRPNIETYKMNYFKATRDGVVAVNMTNMTEIMLNDNAPYVVELFVDTSCNLVKPKIYISDNDTTFQEVVRDTIYVYRAYIDVRFSEPWIRVLVVEKLGMPQVLLWCQFWYFDRLQTDYSKATREIVPETQGSE